MEEFGVGNPDKQADPKLAPVEITDNIVDKLKSHRNNHESKDVGGSMLDSILRKLCSGNNGKRC